MKKILIIFLFNIFYINLKSHGDFIKTNAPIYQNPFDLASGGASLTRATQEGIFFSNPSLPAFGDGVFRWIFFRNTLHIGDSSLDTVTNIVNESSNLGGSQIKAILDGIMKNPVYVGVDTMVGTITSNVSISAFASGFGDIEGKKFGSIGSPEITLKSLSFSGAAATLSYKFGNFLAVGISPKYIYATEINHTFELINYLDTETLGSDFDSVIKSGSAVSTNAGVTLQFQNENFDLRLAGTVDEIGNTVFDNPQMQPWYQTYNVGAGFTLHDFDNALHCSVDYRDLENVYAEDFDKKIYFGCKALFTRYFGFGYGYYQGWPTFGIVLNLFLLRLEAGYYTKNVGTKDEEKPRNIYFVTLGFEI